VPGANVPIRVVVQRKKKKQKTNFEPGTCCIKHNARVRVPGANVPICVVVQRKRKNKKQTLNLEPAALNIIYNHWDHNDYIKTPIPSTMENIYK